MNEAATAALENLIKLPDHELTVAGILEPIYKHRSDWAKLVEVYEIMVRHSLDPVRKIELLHEIARLYEEGGENGLQAFLTHARALREDPTRDDTQKQLERLRPAARSLAGPGEPVRRSGRPGEPRTWSCRSHLWTRIAQIYETNLADNGQAAAAYHKVLGVDGGNLPAANALEHLYLRTDQHQKLVDVVLAKVDMVSDVAEKKELYFKAARLYVEVLENPDKAIEVYKGVLEQDAVDPVAIAALEQLFINLKRWGDLKDIYARQVEPRSDLRGQEAHPVPDGRGLRPRAQRHRARDRDLQRHHRPRPDGSAGDSGSRSSLRDGRALV